MCKDQQWNIWTGIYLSGFTYMQKEFMNHSMENITLPLAVSALYHLTWPRITKSPACDQPRNMPRTWLTNKGTNLWSLVVPPQLGLQGRVIGIQDTIKKRLNILYMPNRKRARPPSMSDGGCWPACSPALRDQQWEEEKMEIEGVPFEGLTGGEGPRDGRNQGR